MSLSKLGKFNKAITPLKKIGGPIVGLAFAAYTFYRISDATGWSSTGMKIGGLYAGMGIGYLAALTIIGSCGPVGAVIAGLIAISDIITWAITGEGWSDKIMNWVVRKLSDIHDPPDVDLDITSTNVIISDYEANGLDVGDRIEFQCRATEIIKRTDDTKESDMRDSYLKPYAEFSGSTRYNDGSYRYEVSNSLTSEKRTRVWEFGAWVEPKKADIDFSAKVNLKAYLKIYYREDGRQIKTKNYDYGDTKLVFDVMPGSLEDFLNWSVLKPLENDDDGLADSVEDGTGPWFRIINDLRTEEADKTVALYNLSDGKPEISETTGVGAHWQFVPSEDGTYLLMNENTDMYLNYQRSSDELDMQNEITDDYGRWDFEPFVDNLYFISNRGKSEAEDVRYCLAADPEGGSYPKILRSRDAVDEAMWSLSAEKSPSNAYKEDTDGDGISDSFEINYLSQGSIIDANKPDTDGDNLTDKEELDQNTNPTVMDTDDDGLNDKEELNGWYIRLRYNSLVLTKKVFPDPVNPDSDGDGLSDEEEMNAVPPLNPRSIDTDGDGIPDPDDNDPLNPPEGLIDTDYDKLSDETENTGWEITVVTAEGSTLKRVTSDPTLEDSDSDTISDREEYGITDPRMDDTDEDGITDNLEHTYGTDATNFDTDMDGISDGTEKYVTGTDPLDSDSDDDGLKDGEEVNTYGSNPLVNDTDNDGIVDADEINITGTDPANEDSDGDGLSDGSEIDAWHTDPLNVDSDGDNLTDREEVISYETNPNNSDTDNDGIDDETEAKNLDDVCSDPNLMDTDEDGLNDYEERYLYGTSACYSDSDSDGLKDGDEIGRGTNPLNNDSDGDTINDGDEVSRYETDPLNMDTDGDTITDDMEITIGTNPIEEDTDGDGINDNLDLDSNPFTIDKLLVLYDEATYNVNGDDIDNFISEISPFATNVLSGTPEDFPDLSIYQFIVMIGLPEDFTEGDGSVAEMIYNLTDEETRANMLEKGWYRFAISVVHQYTGLPIYSGNPLNPIGNLPTQQPSIQVNMGLDASLVVMLAKPYKYDVSRTLSRFVEMKQLYWNNFLIQAYTTDNIYTNPITEISLDGFENIDGRENIDATIENAQLSTNAGFAVASLVSFNDDSTLIELTSDNGLAAGHDE